MKNHEPLLGICCIIGLIVIVLICVLFSQLSGKIAEYSWEEIVRFIFSGGEE